MFSNRFDHIGRKSVGAKGGGERLPPNDGAGKDLDFLLGGRRRGRLRLCQRLFFFDGFGGREKMKSSPEGQTAHEKQSKKKEKPLPFQNHCIWSSEKMFLKPLPGPL